MIALLLAGLTGLAPAQEMRGFTEIRASGAVGVEGTPWSVVERVRPTLQVPVMPRVQLTTTLELWTSQGRHLPDALRTSLLGGDVGPVIEAFCDWPRSLDAAEGVSDAGRGAAVDRLYLDLFLPAVDLRIGRQALQWGSGFFLNPTDPLPQVLFAEPWRPRQGVNAVRATVPVGDVHQVQAVVSLDDTFRYARVAARGTVNIGSLGLSLVGAYRGDSDDGLVGLDVRGAYEVGFFAEGALHVGGARGVYEELTVGVDYIAPVLETMVFVAGYYRNGAADPDASPLGAVSSVVEPEDLPDCTGAVEDLGLDLGAEPEPFAPLLPGRDYVFASAQLGLLPELSVTLVGLQDLDGTGLFVPTVSTRPTGWLTVALSAQVPYRAWGDGGTFKPSTETLQPSFELVPGASLSADLTGLVPDATVIGWVRASY